MKRPTNEVAKPKVYYKKLSSDNLVKLYELLSRKDGGWVAVKLLISEHGNNNYMNPDLIKIWSTG